MSFNRLTWGVKASFRSYVEAAGGSIELDEGASRADDGSFVFTALPGGDLNIAPDGSATGSMRFQGTVTFEAHGGMLKSTIAELGLESSTDGLVVTSLDAPMNQDRCDIAKVSQVNIGADGAITLETEITMDGMYQIADNYAVGTPLDPVRLD